MMSSFAENEVMDNNELFSNYPSPSSTSSENSVSVQQFSPGLSMINGAELVQPCAICGAASTGVHYKVLSCNGCKTFFCRYAFSKTDFLCIRMDSNCFANLQLNNSKKIKMSCRRCRLDRCIQQGMRKKEVITSMLPEVSKTMNECSLSERIPSKNTAATNKVKEITSVLRNALRLLSKFRRTKVQCEAFDVEISKLLLPTNLMENIKDYEPFGSILSFKRDIPEWLTIDLVFAIEFAKQLPDFDKFTMKDKEELVRSSCFILAIAIQVIDSYFEGYSRVILPDGTDLIKLMDSVDTTIDPYYHQMFVSVMGPLNREEFTEDEILLTLQLLFFTNASQDNLSENGQILLNEAIEASIQNLMVLLVSQGQSTFPARYGALTSLNEKFVTVASLHKLKMKAADSFRQKNRDFLIEQLVFGYRSV